eukprot:gene38502-50559_t
MHLARALRAVVGREIGRFLRQPSRLGSALVRPLLWFVVFSAGFHNVFGVAIVPPYETYIEYKVYMVPGLMATTCSAWPSSRPTRPTSNT